MRTHEVGTAIEEGATVNEVIRRFPRTVEVFHRYGIDACCGGALPVAEVLLRHEIDPDALGEELARAAGEAR